MALRQIAYEVDLRQQAAPKKRERILIHIADSPYSVGLIRLGRRVADYWRADCFAVTVVPGPGLKSLPVEQREALGRHLDFARKDIQVTVVADRQAQ